MADRTDPPTFDVELTGCRPEPLASYLKALGVLRLVAEQKDKDASGCWHGEHFVLRSVLDRDALTRFFVEEWRPTPIVAPWNSGSGFWPSTSDDALRAIEASEDPRLAGYASTIELARGAISALGLSDAPDKGEPKTMLLTRLRATSSEEALAWLDAAAVLTEDDPIYPALLGTGGNDGRQDFSNNFMQRALEALDGSRTPDSSIFDISVRSGTKGSMGQFAPSSLKTSNPWDFVFAIEGAMVLAGAATRRLESTDGSTLAFPFHARAATAPSLADGEEGHGELWLPRWTTPSSFREVRRLFAEGRAKTGSGAATTGLDFALSIASLGVDRGVSEFIRFSFQARNGKNQFSTSLGRFPVREVAAARLLDDIDTWYDRFRQKASGNNVPARVAVARRHLEQAMFDAAGTGALGPVLLALGDAERALSRSLAFATRSFLTPLAALPQAWGQAVVDGSVEQRLAAALATRHGIRRRLVPLEKSGRGFGRDDDSDVVFLERPLVDSLHALLQREDIEATQRRLGPAAELDRARCSLTDIARFIEGDVDDMLLERWLRAFVIVDGGAMPDLPADTLRPPAAFAVLSLVCNRRVGDAELPRTAGALARACAGDALAATSQAIRRLNAIGKPLPVAALVEPAARMRRIAAALAIPLSFNQRRTLESMVLPTIEPTGNTTTESSQEHA
jgi:CRISPR-associated protein Csx17